MQTDPSSVSGVDSFTGQWWLCQTRPLYERRLARDLAAVRVDHFLPLTQTRRIKRSRGRDYTVREPRPLFPTYLFVNGDLDARERAARSIATIRVIEVIDQKRLTSELSNLQRALGVDPSLGTLRLLKAGSRVQITGGPFLGLAGVVVEDSDGRRHVMLSVSMLGQAVPVEVPPEFVEPIYDN